MAKFCPRCGSPLRDGAQFCRACGAPVSQSVPQQPAQQQPQQPAYPPQQYPQMQPAAQPQRREQTRGKNRSPAVRVICIILVVALLAGVAVTGFVWPGFLKKKSPDTPDSPSVGPNVPTEPVSTDSTTVTADNPVITVGGVTLDVGDMNLRNGPAKVTVSDMGAGVSPAGENYREYHISVGDQSECDVPVAITFPSLGSAEDCVIEHYDEQLQDWVPLLTLADTGNNTVTAFTDSFSPFRLVQSFSGARLFSAVDVGTPHAMVVLSSNYLSVLKKLDQNEIVKTMGEYAADPASYRLEFPALPDGDAEAMQAGLDEAGLWWTFLGPLTDVTNATVELSTPPLKYMLMGKEYAYYASNFQADVSSALTDVSLLTMGLQVSLDVYRYGIHSETTALNAYKNLFLNSGTLYSAYTGYSSAAFSLMFLGVAIVGLGLDYTVNYAQQIQTDTMQKLFDTYYTVNKPFDKWYWYDLFKEKMWETGDNAEKAMAAVNAALDEYASAFWTVVQNEGDELTDVLIDAGISNIYSISQEQKDSMTAKFKMDLRQRFNNEVMPEIQKLMISKTQKMLYNKLMKIASPFNKTLYITVQETVDLETTAVAKYAGCTLAFGKNGSAITEDGWYLEIPEPDESADWNTADGWRMDFDATDYAWMLADMPDTVFVFESTDAMKNGSKPLYTQKFSLVTTGSRTTLVDLSSLSLEELLGEYEGTVTLKAIKLSDAAYASYLADQQDDEGGDFQMETMSRAECDAALSENVEDGTIIARNTVTVAALDLAAGTATISIFIENGDDEEVYTCTSTAQYSNGVFTIKTELGECTITAIKVSDGVYRLVGTGAAFGLSDPEEGVGYFIIADLDVTKGGE